VSDDSPAASIGVFGGSGFTSLLDDVEVRHLDTPWGAPSGPVHLGTVGDVRVAFLARHGPGHSLPPHMINYRANAWVMHELGVSAVYGPCAAGSLDPRIRPGDLVVCDQLVDRTYAREQTFFDGPVTNHVSFADPYTEHLRRCAIEAARAEGVPVHETGTVVVVQGPRFSTRAESAWFRAQGWQVVNMTQYPEAFLARELGICYATIALITDYDTGLEGMPGVEPVSQAEVFAFFDENLDRLRSVLLRAIEATDLDACDGSDATNGLRPVPPGGGQAGGPPPAGAGES
jgi:5'-methylthioadenosine phosphorylase